MFSAAQIQRLLDIANAGCHKGLVLDARAIYESVLTAKPDFAPALIGLAFSHLVVDDFAVAECLLAQVLARNPDDKDALVTLGFCYTMAQRADKATELLEPLVDDPSSAGNLATDLLHVLRQ